MTGILKLDNMKKIKFNTFFKALSLALISLAIGFSAAITLTKAWFELVAIQEPGWDATSKGAYYAYGNGKPRNNQNNDQPYGITKPIHLYNLAWLQYLGFYDKDNDDNGSLDTIYFELGADINMSGWILPPIGTRNNPFIGNFNGNGYKITGLTISNNINEYNRKPYNINSSDFPNSVNILGLFGVVGKYEGNNLGSYSTQTNQIINTGISGLTVKSSSNTSLVGFAAGYLNGTLQGVAVNNSSFDLRSSGGLPVDSTNMTSNISDYSLIGYSKQASSLARIQNSTTTQYTPTVANPFMSQGGNDWGGSIEMDTMYDILHRKMVASHKHSETLTTHEEQERTYNSDGSFTPSSGFTPVTSASQTQAFTDNNNFGKTDNYERALFYYENLDTCENDSQQTVVSARYNFASNKSNDTNDDNKYSQTGTALLSNDAYVGLGGKTSLGQYNYNLKSSTYASNTYTFYNQKHSLYLGATQSAIIPSTTSTHWICDTSNHYFTFIDNNIYYLNRNGSNLYVDEIPSTTWEWDATKKTLKTSNLYIVYSEESQNWILDSVTSFSYNVITNTAKTRYLKLNGTQVTVTSDPTEAAHIFYDGNYPYVLFDGNDQKYYFKYDGDNNIVQTGTSGRRYQYNTNNNTLTHDYRALIITRTYYLSIGDSSTGCSTSSSNVAKGTIEDAFSFQRENGSYTFINNPTTVKSIYSTDTYYPLTFNDDENGPSNRNTGYVIGGSNYVSNDNPSIGDIRFSSYYTTSMLNNSFISGSNYSYSNLFAYTFDSEGNLKKIADEANGLYKNGEMQTDDSDYMSYDDLGYTKYYYQSLGKPGGSKTALKTMLGESGNDNIAYGLHFMNANISNTNKINVPYVKINGTEKTDYDLPRDAIDFNLKTDGLINFFAATYFVNTSNGSTVWNNSNNSFFSLHWIDRNADNNNCTIDNIKQIAKIYKNTAHDNDPSQPKYVYTYRDANDNEVDTYFDTGIRDASHNMILGSLGPLVFDTYWLTDPVYSNFKLKALYYFEIPVNNGEYALGSTTGTTKTSRGWGTYNKNGAYLLYLDIGASAKNTAGITIEDKSVTITKKYNYPVGVDFKVLSTAETGNYTDVLGGESSAVVIPSGNRERISYTYTPRTNDKATLSVGPPGGGGSYSITYKTTDTVVTNASNVALSLVNPVSTTTDIMERDILYDLRDFTDGTAVTPDITTIHTINGVRGNAVPSSGTPVVLTEAYVKAIPTFEPEEDVTLYVVDYSKTVLDNDSNKVILNTTYDFLTNDGNNIVASRIYSLTFNTSEANKKAEVMFITLNTSQQLDQNTTYTYTVIVLNNNADTSTQLGQISSTGTGIVVVLITGS